MNETAINWDSIPDIITKDQLYQICHISKSTALYLLRSGKIPCEYTGKKTRCYKIKKADVITYLEKRKVFPESYSAPAGWYKGNYAVKMSAEVPEHPDLIFFHFRSSKVCSFLNPSFISAIGIKPTSVSSLMSLRGLT